MSLKEKPPLTLLVGFRQRAPREMNRKVYGFPDVLCKKLREESDRLGVDESELVRSILFQYFNARP